jgi:hypothetical protein
MHKRSTFRVHTRILLNIKMSSKGKIVEVMSTSIALSILLRTTFALKDFHPAIGMNVPNGMSKLKRPNGGLGIILSCS